MVQLLEPATDILQNAVMRKGLISDRNLHRKNAEMHGGMRKIVEALNEFTEVRQPALPDVSTSEDIKANANTWADRIVKQLVDHQVGRVRVTDYGVIASYYETEKQNGFFNHSYKRVRHVHKIARVKWLRLPVAIDVPPPQQKIINRLCEAGLKRHVRIGTGDLIAESQRATDAWEERTKLGHAVDSIFSGTRKAANATSRGVAAGAAGLVDLIAAPFVLFAGDPIICIGDVCLGGWVL